MKTTFGQVADFVLALSCLGAVFANYAMALEFPEWLVVALAGTAGLSIRKTVGMAIDRKK